MFLTRKPYLYIIAAVFAAWAVYCYNPFALYFQNDDFTNILLSSKQQLFQRNSFRPVCDLSIMLDYKLWGINPVGYHIVNLLLHIICTCLVYLFCKRITGLYHPNQQVQVLAFIAALLFFTYPMHSESVYWILGRSGSLGAVFSFLFLMFFIKEKPKRIDVLASIIFYIIALLTYESSWILPVVAALLLGGVQGRGWALLKQRRYHFIVVFVIFIVYLFLRWKQNNDILDNYEAQNFIQYNIKALAKNAAQLFVRSFTSYIETPVWLSAGFSVMFICILIAAFKKVRQRDFKPFYLLACFVISLLPYLSLGIDAHGTDGERFLYLPSVFLCIFIVMVLPAFKERFAIVFMLFIGLIYSAQLYVNAGNYSFAGKIVKETLIEIVNSDTKRITIEGLPRAQHGAMILESGLPHAIELMRLPFGNNDVNILSLRSELKPLQQTYPTLYFKGDGNVRLVFTDTALLIYR